jgi:hypothetical protein
VIFTFPLTFRDCAAAASEKRPSAVSTCSARDSSLPLVEQVDAKSFLERSDPPGDGRLADSERSRGRKRAAVAGDGQKITKVVPVEH